MSVRTTIADSKALLMGILLFGLPFVWIWAADESLVRLHGSGYWFYSWCARLTLVANGILLILAVVWLLTKPQESLIGKVSLILGALTTIVLHGVLIFGYNGALFPLYQTLFQFS